MSIIQQPVLKSMRIIICLGILSSILESHEEDHVCILGDFNAAAGLPRFNKICDIYY